MDLAAFKTEGPSRVNKPNGICESQKENPHSSIDLKNVNFNVQEFLLALSAWQTQIGLALLRLARNDFVKCLSSHAQ